MDQHKHHHFSTWKKNQQPSKDFWTDEGTDSKKKKEQDAEVVLDALEVLVSRLGEFTHNLEVPASNPALMDSFFEGSLFPDDTSTTKDISVEELAEVFCRGYVNLPPLQLGNITSAATSNQKIDMVQETRDCPRRAILFFLAQQCGPPGLKDGIVSDSIQDIQCNANNISTVKHLQKAWTPIYEELFQCLLEENSQYTVNFLVEIRGDLLRLMRILPKENQESLVEALKELERHLRRLLSVWFSPGLLEIRRVTYDDTSAGIIEKIALKEAVHPMKSLDDLRQRLGPKRRVFALFHPLLKEEPLVILHVHLESKPDHIPSKMEHVLAEADADGQDFTPLVATFYSISNTQSGLTGGLGLGEFVIKQAVQLLQREFPNSIRTFVTLSPMPTFRKWVEGIVPKKGNVIEDQAWAKELRARGDLNADTIELLIEARPELEALIHAKKFDEIEKQLGKVEHLLTKLAAHYLIVAKKKGRSEKPLDAVTGFHVGNGAEVFRVNFGADFSRKGLLRSFGVMVNYRYELDNIAHNKAKFESSQYSHIPTTAQVKKLL